MSDPNLIEIQEPFIWFVSANLDPTPSESIIDDGGFSGDPNWLFPWWNHATGNIFWCTDSTPGAMIWKRMVSLDSGRTYSSESVSFGTPRTPNNDKETIVIASVEMINTLLTTSTINVEVDDAGDGIFNTIATVGMSGVAAMNTQSITFNVPASSQYKIVESGSGTNTIISICELPL